MTAARNDVLSDVLTLIRLRGELVYTAFLGEPWGLQFQPGPAHFHFIEKGEAWVMPSGEKPTRVNEGDLVLLPLGKGHVITDALSSPVESIGIVAANHFDRDELVLRHGGDGPVTKAVGGFFSFEGSPLPAVMSALPPLIHIPRGDAGAPPWLAAISHFLVAEAQQPNPGSALDDFAPHRSAGHPDAAQLGSQARRTAWAGLEDWAKSASAGSSAPCTPIPSGAGPCNRLPRSPECLGRSSPSGSRLRLESRRYATCRGGA